ncbi:hypothetical protein LCGC14_2469090 [marine sediment metagenome]|uniref:Uncharacterized protein n=1 Tax=marine sediment metagenome TaxID=412755 RepID=A0A0F9DN08_9ZZZZ
MKTTLYRPGSDELGELTRGFVMADRINDILARPNSKQHRDYLSLIRDQFMGEPVFDHNDQYREQAKELLPRALDHFNRRHEISVIEGLLFIHSEEFPMIAAAPDAVWGDLVGLTVHIRQSEETYAAAVERGVDKEMERHAQAMMLVTGLPIWLHLSYFEDANERVRRLHEHEVEFNERHAEELEDAMIGFILKSRLRAAA